MQARRCHRRSSHTYWTSTSGSRPLRVPLASEYLSWCLWVAKRRLAWLSGSQSTRSTPTVAFHSGLDGSFNHPSCPPVRCPKHAHVYARRRARSHALTRARARTRTNRQTGACVRVYVSAATRASAPSHAAHSTQRWSCPTATYSHSVAQAADRYLLTAYLSAHPPLRRLPHNLRFTRTRTHTARRICAGISIVLHACAHTHADSRDPV